MPPWFFSQEEDDDDEDSFHTPPASPIITVVDISPGEPARPNWITPNPTHENKVIDSDRDFQALCHKQRDELSVTDRILRFQEDRALVSRQNAVINQTLQSSTRTATRQARQNRSDQVKPSLATDQNTHVGECVKESASNEGNQTVDDLEQSEVLKLDGSSDYHDNHANSLGSQSFLNETATNVQSSDLAVTEFKSRAQRHGIRTPGQGTLPFQNWQEFIPSLPQAQGHQHPENLTATFQLNADENIHPSSTTLHRDIPAQDYDLPTEKAEEVEDDDSFQSAYINPDYDLTDNLGGLQNPTPPPGRSPAEEAVQSSIEAVGIALQREETHLVIRRMDQIEGEIAENNALRRADVVRQLRDSPRSSARMGSVRAHTPLRDITNLSNPTTRRARDINASQEPQEPLTAEEKAERIRSHRMHLTAAICEKYFRDFQYERKLETKTPRANMKRSLEEKRSPLSWNQLIAIESHNKIVEELNRQSLHKHSTIDQISPPHQLATQRSAFATSFRENDFANYGQATAQDGVNPTSRHVASLEDTSVADLLTDLATISLPSTLQAPLTPQPISPRSQRSVSHSVQTERLNVILAKWRTYPNLYREAGYPSTAEATLGSIIRLLRKYKADVENAKAMIQDNVEKFFEETFMLSTDEFEQEYQAWKAPYEQYREMDWQYYELLHELLWVFDGQENLPGGLATEFVL